MKTIQNKLIPRNKITTKKEIQELQKALELAAFKLKKSKNKEDQLLANFLANNYIHPETGLITSKQKQESHSISCKAKDFRHSIPTR
jgi:hypothetical protein